MTTHHSRVASVLLFLVGCLTIASGQTPGPAASATVSSSPAQAPQLPPVELDSVPWFTWGGDVRVRNEYFDNALSLTETSPTHEQDLFRVRARLWSTVTFMPDLTFNLRLAAEPRVWERPAFAKQHAGTGAEDRYAIPDNFNLKWTHAFGLPLTITAGRQDVQFGDPLNWWLVGDGTPVDGSWSFFLDSVRAALDVPQIKTKFDVVCIDQHAKPDTWLPILGQQGTYSLVEQNERGLILYASNKSLPDTQVDGYFIYKRDEAVFAYSDSGDIYTLGGKITGTPTPHLGFSAEGAWQWGWKQDSSVPGFTTVHRDIQAYGGNAKLSYLCKDPMDNQVSLAAEYLSGDDPGTPGKDEMFDVLWGRWPRFSELYIYSYPMETAGKVAQLNNLFRLGPTWSFVPAKDTTVSLTYNALFAPESVPTRTVKASLFSETGHFRGNFVQLWVKHQFSKHLSGQVWAEVMREGDYYARRDLLSYLRAEMQVSF